MTRPLNVDPFGNRLDEGRGRGVHLTGEQRAGAQRIQLHEGGVRGGKLGRVGAEGRGKVPQNPLHFAGLAKFQFADLVHRLDGAGRFDEQGPTARGGVMYEAARDSLPLAADRDAVAAVADGDRGVGHANAFR